MNPLGYENAEWASGPKLVAWLEQCGADLGVVQGTQLRMVQRWRTGAQANFYAIDTMLISLGLHPSMVPECIWCQYDNGRRRSVDLVERRAA
jgi:hypothetical protein